MKKRKPFNKLAAGDRVTSEISRNRRKPMPSSRVPLTPKLPEKPKINKNDLDCGRVVPDPNNPGYTFRYDCKPKPGVVVEECTNNAGCPRGLVCRNNQCVKADSQNVTDPNPADPIAIQPQEYYCNGDCVEAPSLNSFTCDNVNNENFNQIVSRIEDCYDVSTMPDGRRWMVEDLMQLRIHDDATQSDGSKGSYIFRNTMNDGFFDDGGDQWVGSSESSTEFVTVAKFTNRPSTSFYNFWAADNFGVSRYGICPPGWHVPTVDEVQTFINSLGDNRVLNVGVMLKDAGVCPQNPDASCDLNGDGIEDGYWFEATFSTQGQDTYNFSLKGWGYIDFEQGNPTLNNFLETGGFWTSTKYGSQSVGYNLTANYQTAGVNLSFDTHGGYGNAGDGYNIRCVEGEVIGGDILIDDSTDVLAWWQRMEDYVYLPAWNTDQDGNPGDPWIPAEVCINDPNINCDEVQQTFSRLGINLKDGNLRAQNTNTRLDCPSGPVYYNPSSGNVIPFDTDSVGVSPGGCIRQTYIGEAYVDEEYQGEPVNDIGCCDTVLNVYGSTYIYNLQDGNLHNCFYTDGLYKYQCGGCSCIHTPNNFSTVLPAYHRSSNSANWAPVTLWEGEDGLVQYTDGYQYGGTIGNGGYAESIGPSCPDLMCVGGTYNGMYCSGDNFYGVDQATCEGGEGTCLNGSGCSWGMKDPIIGFNYPAGWNGNDYSCCPGCQTPNTTPDGDIDASCVNDFLKVDKSDVNWADYGWNYSLHGYYSFFNPDGSFIPGYYSGTDWVSDTATFEEWSIGICSRYADICIPPAPGWNAGPEFECSEIAYADCPDFEIGDDVNGVDSQYCYNPEDGISPGGCCGKNPIDQTCIYKGCTMYEDCINSFSGYWDTEFCIENCQNPSVMGNPSFSEILHYGDVNLLISEGFAIDSNGEITLCLPDSDGDGICDADDIGPGDYDYSLCPANNFDCLGVCCSDDAALIDNEVVFPCAYEDECGQCTGGTSGLEVNNLDVGCGCYNNGTGGPAPDNYWLDGDGDGLGSGNPQLYCTTGGIGCTGCDNLNFPNTIYESIGLQQQCEYGVPGGWCGNNDEEDLSYDHDYNPDTDEIVVSGDDCPTNEVGCNGCCSDTGEFGLPVCGTYDACGNCVPGAESPGLYCLDQGIISCGDGVIAGELDLSGRTFIMADCQGVCCGPTDTIITTPLDGNVYDTCAYQDYFYQDLDGDGFANGSGTGDPLCQIDGIPTGDYIACADGNVGGYCLASSELDVDGEDCYCPENVTSDGYEDGTNPCYDCMGECRQMMHPNIFCLTDQNNDIIPNQVTGCATIDSNAGTDNCPTNHCIYGSSDVQDACVEGCGTYYEFGDEELTCPGEGVEDGCGLCGGTCCFPSTPGSEQPEGCLECGCWDIETQFSSTGGFVGSVTPGEVCDCGGSLVDACGVCGGDGLKACTDYGGCNPTQYFCDAETPEVLNGNQPIYDGYCETLDACGVCGGGGRPSCDGFDIVVGGPCNAGNETYCGGPNDGDGDDCSIIDGCGYCGGNIDITGISCTDYNANNTNTTADTSTGSVVITIGDYCSDSQYYCTGTDPAEIGGIVNCTKRFDCNGGCYEYNEAEDEWGLGASIIDDCGVCRDWNPSITDWDNFNSDDVGCGCFVQTADQYFLDYDGDGKADPQSSEFYATDWFCGTLGNLTTENTIYELFPENLGCGLALNGWCASDGVVWDEPINGIPMWDCPCNKKDCAGNCCIDPGDNNQYCIETTGGYVTELGQSGNFCLQYDCSYDDTLPASNQVNLESCGGDLELDECGICDGPGPIDWWLDSDGDGLGAGDSISSCTSPGDNWVILDGNMDMYPDCTCIGNTNIACVDCNEDCRRDENGDSFYCFDEGDVNSGANDFTPGCALVDECGTCVLGATGLLPCVQDCNGTWGGAAIVDACGVCCSYEGGPICDEGKTCNWENSLTCNDGAFIGECGECLLVNTDSNINKDCNGDCFGNSYLDPNCGDCINPDIGELPCTQDCLGVWGGDAIVDECGDCEGNGAGDLGCGCGQDAPQNHYWDSDGDLIPDNPNLWPSSPSKYCLTRNDVNFVDNHQDYAPLVPAGSGCGVIGGWCLYSDSGPWDVLPNCPCNATHCDSGLQGDCCDPDGNGTCYGHYQLDGNPYEQCRVNDDCGNCGGSCVCSGNMITNADGNLECVNGDIVCPEASADQANHYLAVGCGNVCVLYGQIPSFDQCGDCGGACFTPEIPGSPGCQECGCKTVIEIMCDDDSDGVIDDNCPGGSVGSTTYGEYCNCEGQILDACGNCGGACYGTPGDIECSDSDFNYVLADCNGFCGTDLIGTGVDGIGTDACGICGGPGAIYNCADLPDTPCGASGLCESQLSSCSAPDSCGNCGGDCQTLDDGTINCNNNGINPNNTIINGCDGLCHCGTTNGIPNYSDVNDGVCYSFDYCGFCVDHGTGYIDNGELCDNAPSPFCGSDMYYCPIGGVGSPNLANYSVPGTCNVINECNQCVEPNVHYLEIFPYEPIENGGYCPGGTENIDKICNCDGDRCDNCGICGGDNSSCTGCVNSATSCEGITNGGGNPCNPGVQADGSVCYHWGDTDNPSSCEYNDGTTCNCPLGNSTCYYDDDCDGDRESTWEGYLDCDTVNLGGIENCSNNNDCNLIAQANCGVENICNSVQGELGEGCMTPGTCNYDEFADLPGSEANGTQCLYPGDAGYTCSDWGFQCVPNIGNSGDELDNVLACEPGGAVTNWQHWYADKPAYTVDMNEAGCFNPIDPDNCGCSNGPASQHYECLESCEWIDINGNTNGATGGCSYYDNGFFENTCQQPQACTSYLTPGAGQKVCSPDGSEGLGSADGCAGQGCFLTAIECSCGSGQTEDYVNPDNCGPDCAGGGCAPIGDPSNDCEPLPPCTSFFPSEDESNVCGGIATSCTNADNHCYDKDYRCDCSGTDANGIPYGNGAIYVECFEDNDPWGGNVPAGCTPNGCTNDISSYCQNVPGDCADNGNQYHCNPNGWATAMDCNGTGCYESQCDNGMCIDPAATQHNCNPGCAGDNDDQGCWVGECEPNYSCTDVNGNGAICNADNETFGSTDDCTRDECWTPNTQSNSEACAGVPADSEGCCGCEHGIDAIEYSFTSCLPGCGSVSGREYPGCNDPCVAPGDVPCSDYYDCGPSTPSSCDNSTDECYDYDNGCDCDLPVRCSCLTGCNTSQGGTGTTSCEPRGTDCANVCDEPIPCVDWNNGNCPTNLATGGTIASDCLGTGCVTNDEVDAQCCDWCFINQSSSGCEFTYCTGVDIQDDSCGEPYCGGGSVPNPCAEPYDTCAQAGYQCTYIPEWGIGGDYSIGSWNPIDFDEPWLNSCDASNSCFNLGPEVSWWEQCTCEDGPQAQNCNRGYCNINCEDLSMNECLMMQQDQQNPTPGAGCRWDYISPVECVGEGRWYLTEHECLLLEMLDADDDDDDIDGGTGGGTQPDYAPVQDGAMICPPGTTYSPVQGGICVNDYGSGPQN